MTKPHQPTSSNVRVCIASQSKLGVTDTFIRAHVERLPFQIVPIFGYGLDYEFNGRSLRAMAESARRGFTDRMVDVLPGFIGFRVRRTFFPRLDDIALVAGFLKEQRVDVVLAEYGTTAAFIAPSCKAASIPLVAHFHGFDASHHETLTKFRSAYAFMFQYAAAVIVVSNAMRDAIVALGCDSTKIIVNYYGPNPDFFGVTTDYASSTLLSVGRLTDKKAPHLVLLAFRKAWQRFPSLRLRMIGEGELRGVCEDLISTLGLSDSVTMTGAGSHDDVKRAMGDAFAFIQHSVVASDGDREGTPVAILEAGAAGLPVISTRHEGIPEVVQDGVTGFLGEERDVEQMSISIATLAGDRVLAQRMGTAARARIGGSFSMEKHLGTLTRVLGDSGQR